MVEVDGRGTDLVSRVWKGQPWMGGGQTWSAECGMPRVLAESWWHPEIIVASICVCVWGVGDQPPVPFTMPPGHPAAGCRLTLTHQIDNTLLVACAVDARVHRLTRLVALRADRNVGKRKAAALQVTGGEQEMMTEGGELEFVRRMIVESVGLGHRVRHFPAQFPPF